MSIARWSVDVSWLFPELAYFEDADERREALAEAFGVLMRRWDIGVAWLLLLGPVPVGLASLLSMDFVNLCHLHDSGLLRLGLCVE